MEIFIFYVGNILVNIIDMFLVHISRGFIGNPNHRISRYIMIFAEFFLPILNMFIFILCVILKFTKYSYLIQSFGVYNIYFGLLYLSFILNCIIFFISVIYWSVSLVINRHARILSLVICILLLFIAYGILYFIHHILFLKEITGYINNHYKITTLIVLGWSIIQIIIRNFKSDNDDNVYTRLYEYLERHNYIDENVYLSITETIRINSKISKLFMIIGLVPITYSFILILRGVKYWERVNEQSVYYFDYKILAIALGSLIIDLILIEICNLIMSYIYYHHNNNNSLLRSIEDTTVLRRNQINNIYDKLFIFWMFVYNILSYIRTIHLKLDPF